MVEFNLSKVLLGAHLNGVGDSSNGTNNVGIF